MQPASWPPSTNGSSLGCANGFPGDSKRWGIVLCAQQDRLLGDVFGGTSPRRRAGASYSTTPRGWPHRRLRTCTPWRLVSNNPTGLTKRLRNSAWDRGATRAVRGVGVLRCFADAEDLGPALRAGALSCGAAVLQCDLCGALDLLGFAALDAVCLSHTAPPLSLFDSKFR